MQRRSALKQIGSAALGLGAPLINLGRFQLFSEPAPTYSSRCIDLVHRSLVIDMLSQFKLGAFPDIVVDRNRPTARWWSHPETFTVADLQRYLDSGINVFHLGWGTGRDDPYEGATKVLDAWRRFIAYHAKNFVAVGGAEDFAPLKRQNKIGILLGFQGSDHFRTTTDVETFFRLDQRVSQLTYNVQNRIGSGYEAPDSGLTHFGIDVVKRMNQLGMAIDLSHCGPRTTADACELSNHPVLFTHANCKALLAHPRNKSDTAIRAMAVTGGVMGITAVRMFVGNHEPVTIENVLDHYDHVAKLVGVEHVGIGSDIDLDGYDKLPPTLRARMLTGYKNSPAFHGRGDIDGLNHPKRIYDLTDGLIRRKYSDANIAGILGGNFRRALAAIWKV